MKQYVFSLDNFHDFIRKYVSVLEYSAIYKEGWDFSIRDNYVRKQYRENFKKHLRLLDGKIKFYKVLYENTDKSIRIICTQPTFFNINEKPCSNIILVIYNKQFYEKQKFLCSLNEYKNILKAIENFLKMIGII